MRKITIILAAFVAIGFIVAKAVPSGSNSNPGAIRFNPKNKWVGQVGERNGFVVFSEPKFGARAMLIIIKKRVREGKTLAQVVNTWAPPSENNTQNYIRFVQSKTGISPNQKVRHDQIVTITQAIIQFEGSKLKFSDAELSKILASI